MATGIVRRRYRIILICFLLTLPIGPLYYFLAPQTYTASATMLMETQNSSLQETLSGVTPHDAAWVDSQLGVLRSQNVAAYVVKQLRLAEDPQFYQSEGPLGSAVVASRLGG